jgi:hypothetical protein
LTPKQAYNKKNLHCHFRALRGNPLFFAALGDSHGFAVRMTDKSKLFLCVIFAAGGDPPVEKEKL